MSPQRYLKVVPMLLAAVLALLSVMPALAHGAGSTQEGWLTVIHWTPRPGSQTIAQNAYFLNFDDGHRLQLDIAPELLAAAGGMQALRGTRVQVTLSEADARAELGSGSRVRVQALQPALIPLNTPRGAMESRLSGSQAWVTLMCAFPGSPVGADTDTLAYFQQMYSAEYPGMDHYWREQSFNNVNLLGSEAYGWFTLPNPQSFYYAAPGSGQDPFILETLFDDCVAAADASVDFNPFVGINMMFNGELDCCAWGGSLFATLDGANKLWRATWNPPWSWRDITVVSHEVGHGFGLPHANNYDGDANPYDNPWDVMSDTYSFCGLLIDPAYGCLGQHTSSYHKDILGWFDNAQRLVISGADVNGVTLEHVALQNATSTQIIIVPIEGSNRYYTVEARQTTASGYDAKLPGKAVIIHEVDESRVEPAWLVGGTNDALSESVTTGLDGAWLVGETFAGSGVNITVDSETANGFVVSVDVPNVLFSNTSMEADIDLNKIPDGWSGSNLTSDSRKCNKVGKPTVSHTGECAFVFKGGVGEASKLKQDANLSAVTLAAGNTVTLDALVSATSAGAAYKVTIKVKYTDINLPKDKMTVEGTTNGGYQLFTATVTLDNAAVSKISAQISHTSLSGKVNVDDATLTVSN